MLLRELRWGNQLVLLGDWNSSLDRRDPSIPDKSAPHRILYEAGLVDAFRQDSNKHGITTMPNTYHGYHGLNYDPTVHDAYQTWYLDAIYVYTDVAIATAEIVRDRFPVHGELADFSDHYGVEVVTRN